MFDEHTYKIVNNFSFSMMALLSHNHNVRILLKQLIKNIHLNPDNYNTMSLRIGRASDLLKFGFSIETIKRMGRWKSNAVYRYIRYL